MTWMTLSAAGSCSFFDWILYFPGTLQPVLSNMQGGASSNLHLLVIELPEIFVFEKICFFIRRLEHSIDIVGDSVPHGDISRIVKLYVLDFFIKPPIHGACDDIWCT